MSENILVVEYEPRYTDRVKQALAGQPFTTTFARDGEEAMQALEAQPRLIVLSSVVPKISTTELIRAIRGRKPLQDTPILLTVSGYNGKSPKQDAQRVGASDILPKPYSEHEFLGKIQQMLGIRGELPPFEDFTVNPTADAPAGLTSNDIFGDMLEEEKPVKKATHSRPTGDVDKMLADTLAGMNVPRRKDHAPAGSTPADGTPAPHPQPAAPLKPRTMPGTGTSELDKRLHDTLSGLEKSARKNAAAGTGSRPAPVAPPEPPPEPAPAPRFNSEKMKPYVADRVPVSQPVFATPEAPRVEEEEATDGIKFGQYVMIEKIATGGMAEVWKARMRGVEGFQKTVAIKKILPHLSDNQDFIEMFVDEAKLAAQLNHNNIIHIYDLGKIQSSYYIAMEYIDGFDLKAILRRGEERGQPMEPQLALFIASKIASALDYAHRKRDFEEKEMGLVHRDVSPQNVLISQEGDIKLCDFGIAKAASKASHTQAGALKGKLQYMSPEQAWGRSIDRRSDIFALATVLFEMLTGRKLFTGDNELSILEQVREAKVTPPSQLNDEVTEDIDRVVMKALEKDPANRYQTAGEMARDIDAILYSFKPTPTSADLAIYMHRMSTTEPMLAAPEPEPFQAPQPVAAVPPKPVMPPFTPVAAAAAAPAVAVAAPGPVAHAEPWAHAEPAAKKRSAVPLIAIGVVLLLAGIAGAVVVMRKKGDAPPTATTPAVTATTAAAPSAATATVPLSTDTTLTTGTTGTVIDPSAVDQEVQKRIAAERARLEALARQQQQQQGATTATVAPPRPAPVQVAETRPAPPQEAPAPVVERPAPAPVTQTQEPAPQVVAPAPAPQQAAPAPNRVREGDLVPVGTEGLLPPRITRRGVVAYPPLAKMQKIGGTVLTNVLVSETGSVIRVEIIRGASRAVGLNEAAQEAMRRSTFAPATKDGVRVKSWLTVPVDFKP